MPKPKGLFQDEAATINTNSYSIVSKRSVEKLYFPDEPSFLEPFVPKFKRRAPLINRGYWLRMRAIESAVNSFLRTASQRSKAVVNLGCGYDPLPFRMRHKGVADDSVLFIDVDYRDLIERKVAVLQSNETFHPFLGQNYAPGESKIDAIEFKSNSYCAVGCDLADIMTLNRIFDEIIPLDELDILFIAEVSITYMTLSSADELLQWASTFDNAQFCILEQFLPDGPDHPFAKTMLDHFSKQSAPIQSVLKYQTLDDHRRRLLNAQWKHVTIQSLWEFWEDPQEIALIEKTNLDQTEPFDEWEEFILFASHYFILLASNRDLLPHWGSARPEFPNDLGMISQIGVDKGYRQRFECVATAISTPARRHGRTAKLSPSAIAVTGGIVESTGHELYGFDKPDCSLLELPNPKVVFHTITEIGTERLLLVGGRTSPSKVSSECYLFDKTAKSWTRVDDIRPARYRHCAAPIAFKSYRGVLVYGGRDSKGDALGDWKLWTEHRGWFHLKVLDYVDPRRSSYDICRFGASIVSDGENSGLLLGGINKYGRLSRISLSWHFYFSTSDDTKRMLHQLDPKYESFESVSAGTITLRHFIHSNIDLTLRSRVGASLISSGWGYLLVGGVGPRPYSRDEEVLVIREKQDVKLPAFTNTDIPRPILTGICVAELGMGEIVITGGGAVCFSFGPHFNTHWYQFSDRTLPASSSSSTQIRCFDDDENSVKLRGLTLSDTPNIADQTSDDGWEMLPQWDIHELDGQNLSDLSNIVSNVLQPCVIRSVDAGDCFTKWDLEYLNAKIGPSTKLSIHRGDQRNLQFHPQKNFEYQTCTFKDFKTQLEARSHVYLRSLASSSPFQKPANLWRDFPTIAQDFQISKAMDTELNLTEKIHSSVLRISGNVAIWLHYDVMSNFLFQIRGSKTVILFPPTDATLLQFAPGATVSTLHITTIEKTILSPGKERTDSLPSISDGKAVTLNPGDVLFIPRFWPHATVTSHNGVNTSIAVNVFFRDLAPEAYAAGRDVYGSRDLAVYENGRHAIRRIVDGLPSSTDELEQAMQVAISLKGGKMTGDVDTKVLREVNRIRQKMKTLPVDVGEFYLPRLAEELVVLAREKFGVNS